MTTRSHSRSMPDILWVIDRDFEQRYYRSATSLAQAINDGFYTPGKDTVYAYRRIHDDEGGHFPKDEIQALMAARQPARERVMTARVGKLKDSSEDRMVRMFEAQTRKLLADTLRKASTNI